MNMRISYKGKSLIYGVTVLALVREIGSVIDARSGINKV